MSLSLLFGGVSSERSGALKGAPLLGAANRTLDGEDRSARLVRARKRRARVAAQNNALGNGRAAVESAALMTTGDANDGEARETIEAATPKAFRALANQISLKYCHP